LFQLIITSVELINLQEFGQECILLDTLMGKHTNGSV